MLVCANCGRENADDARFCSGCGAPLAAAGHETREERKVISVLFADLVGFTSRAEKLDPEDVRATLTPYYARLRGELERRGGTVEKFIGDAVMAVFGAPLAHEDDPERAVRAALAIRDAIVEDDQLRVRVAVTTGEALVTLGVREGEGMAAGDVVNTAARLQNAAPVNGILVDETTFRATRGAIGYSEAEAVKAKGKAEPVPVWEALEARSRFGVDVVQTGAPLVGRQRELDLLGDALGRAREQRSPQLVTLVGVPGIGKSRLVFELSRVVDAQPDLVYWRQGRSLPYGEGVTYWALAEMAKGQAGILETDTPEESGRKLADAVAAFGLEDEERILESLRTLVGVGGEVEARGDRTEHFAAWRRFFEALADQRPTVLVFEDLHWADDDLLDFVDHLVDWGSEVPLLVVCTARPELLERRSGWGGGKPNALTLSISPLSEDETAHLLAALLERAVLPAEVQRTLLARAGGNPLYAEQFARLLEEGGTREDLPLPENVQGIIAARLDGLPAGEKQLLQDAAVFGKVFWLGAVCAVGGRDRGEAESALHGLGRKEFVRRERRSSVGSEEEYAFRHLLVRDVAYGQIPRAARADLHEGAARWIEELGRPEDHGEMLAHHYLEALRLGSESGAQPSEAVSERARNAARDAGDRALALGAFAVAARFFAAALELWPEDDDERPELLLAYLRSRVEDPAVDEALFEEARARLLEAGKVDLAAEAEARLGSIWMLRGDQDAALLHLERARELVEECPSSPEKAFVLQELARTLMMAEHLDRSIQVAGESLRLAEELRLEAARSRNLNTIGCARVVAGDAGGLEDLERALEIAAAANSHEEVSAVANLHSMAMMLGDLEQARELHVQAQEVAERLGLIGYIDWQRGEHAIHCYWGGRWDEALATADEFIREVEAGKTHYMEVACRFVRGLVWVARGEADGGLAELRRASELARTAKDPQVLNPALAAEGRALLTFGDTDGAVALADELLEGWHSLAPRQATECVEAACLFRGLGREQELLGVLARVRGPSPWHEAARRYLSGDFLGAAEAYAEIGTLPDEVYARVKAAEQLVAAGDRAEADAQLRLALPVLTALGASAWQAEAEALLAESA